MKSLLFALGLALCCFVQANQDERFENIDHSKMTGDWIVTAMATDCLKMQNMLSKMSASPISFEQQSADQLKMTMVMATPHGCKTMNPVLKRENGVFTTTCGKGGKKTVEYVQMNENSMFTIITVSHKNGQSTVATLAVKDLADTPAAMDGFRAFADRHGLEGEKIHILSTEGMCPRSS